MPLRSESVHTESISRINEPARDPISKWLRNGLAALFCSAILMSGATSVEAGENEDDLAAIKSRLAVLEIQNAELRSTLSNPSSVFSDVTPASAVANEDDVRVRSIIKQYMADQKAEDEAKKKAAAEVGYEVGSDLAMTAVWNNGLELVTKDKAFRIHIGGRTQLDAGWFNDPVQPPAINIPYRDGVDFRRARLRIDGTMYEQHEFAIEYDFVNSQRIVAPAGTSDFDVTAFTDAWWQLKEIPFFGNIRIGNQKEAIGFEHLVSSRFLPFMERSYNQDAFYGGSFNGFTPGISAFDKFAEDTATWNIGLYKPVNNVFAVNAWDGDWAVTGRVTKLLRYEAEGADLIHVGLGARHATSVQNRVRFRTRDAIRSGISAQWPIPADSSNLFARDGQMIDPELAIVRGPWTVQAEYLASWTNDATSVAGAPGVVAGVHADQVFYHGGYVQAFYFLTGEHDNYSLERGAFDRVKPRTNFFWLRNDDGTQATGWGAWQVGARYNYLDLNDSGINGGELHNFTAGLNWFWNPNLKMQFNYIATHRNSAVAGGAGDAWINGAGMRLAHDF